MSKTLVSLSCSLVVALTAILHANADTHRATHGPNADSGSGKTPRTTALEAICRHWVHSSEEEPADGKVLVYRPADFKKFPPGRFRMQFKFYNTGNCDWYYLSPDDGHFFKPGKWILDPKDETILRITMEGVTQSFRIATISEEQLQLVPLEKKE